MPIIDQVNLPSDIETGAKYGPTWQTSIVPLSSGNEQANSDWSIGRLAGDISYGIQSQADYMAVLDFFNARRGMGRGFLFHDWTDDTLTAEPQGVGDGTNRTFLLIKTYEPDGPNPYVRRITRPNNDITVYVNAVLVDASLYTTGAGGWFRFNAGHAPTMSAIVTASCTFDVPVRFDKDHMDATIIWQGAATIDSIPFIEVRDEINNPPTAIALANTVTTMNEALVPTPDKVFIADIEITDDPFGDDNLYITGPDAASFQIFSTTGTRDDQHVYLNAGVMLDYETQPTYNITVNVFDPTVGTNPAASVAYELTLIQIPKAPGLTLVPRLLGVADGVSTASPIDMAVATIIDLSLGTGTNVLSLTGADASQFQLSGTTLQTKTGITLTADTAYHVTVNVGNSSLTPDPSVSLDFVLTVGVVTVVNTVTATGSGSYLVPLYNTLKIEEWGAGGGGDGYSTVGTAGGDTVLASLGLTAGGGQSPVLNGPVTDPTGSSFFNPIGGAGGTATGGDTNTPGQAGATGFLQRIGTGQTLKAGDGGGNPGSGASVTYNGSPSSLPLGENGSNGAGVGEGGGGSATLQAVIDLSESLVSTCSATCRPGSGQGGYLLKQWNAGDPGAPAPGTTLTFLVGGAGAGGADFDSGGNGGTGQIKFTVT